VRLVATVKMKLANRHIKVYGVTIVIYHIKQIYA